MLTPETVAFVTSGVYGHVVTRAPSGGLHVTLAWCDVDDGDVVFATLFDQAKLRDLRADPRVTISFEAPAVNDHGLRPYLVVDGTATVTPGGAPELLGRLARRYLGPDVRFPPMPDPPPGFVTRVRVTATQGVGPWVV